MKNFLKKPIRKLTCLLIAIATYHPNLMGIQTVELLNVGLYGWLDQYSLDDRHMDYIGKEACVPTSSTNALTYLQNANPFIFGSTLSGTTYTDWENTDEVLINAMGTMPGVGTQWYNFVPALENYVRVTKGYSQVRFSGMFQPGSWPSGTSLPSYIQNANPTIEFIGNALAGGSAVLLSIEYTNGAGGHELLVNGLTWDPDTQLGTISFVDPLDPSLNYSPTIPMVLGPAKQTLANLSVDGNQLLLTYAQYEGRLPYAFDNYETFSATLIGVLAVGGARTIPYSELLLSGNTHAIAEGFDQLDPTTEEIFSVLTVFNTLSQASLNKTFQELDPSLFNAIFFSQENAAQSIQRTLFDHLSEYRSNSQWRCNRCNDSCGFNPGVRLWLSGFAEENDQRSSQCYLSKKGYKDYIRGGILSTECSFCDNLLVGLGASYTKNHVKWKGINAHGDIEGIGGILYGTWSDSFLWVDVNLAYSNSHISATRHVFSESPLYFVEPIDLKISHKNNSNLYAGHLGAGYNLFSSSLCQMEYTLWPYLNLDCYNVLQPSFSEEGGGILDYHVLAKNSKLFRPEIGLGCSLFKKTYRYLAFFQTFLSYASEIRFHGKKTGAYFKQNPDSFFYVSGLFPQNNLICPNLQMGLSSPNESFRIFLDYSGEFGKFFTSNQISAEISIGF